MKNKSYLTAISRKQLPVPTRWLLSKNLITGNVLDFGCGKCSSINPANWTSYDPHFAPINISGSKFDTIVCNYVINTLELPDQVKVLNEIKSLLSDNGVAYVSVRNDTPKNGWGYSSRETYQDKVEHLKCEIIRNTAQYRIFKITNKDNF